MEQFEYIRWYWRYTDDETPVVLFYEVDLANDRYAARMTVVFPDRSAEPVTELGFAFVTEAPVPTVDEINRDPDFLRSSFQKRFLKTPSAIRSIPATSPGRAYKKPAGNPCGFFM